MLETLLLAGSVLLGHGRDLVVLQEKINVTSSELNNIYLASAGDLAVVSPLWEGYLLESGYQKGDSSSVPSFIINNLTITTKEIIGNQLCTINYVASSIENQYSVKGAGSCEISQEYLATEDREEVTSYMNSFLNVLEEKTKTLKTPNAGKIVWATLVDLKLNTSKKPSKNFLQKNQKIKLKNGEIIVTNKGKKIRVVYVTKNKTSCFFDIRITKTTIISNEQVTCGV